ncbi:MAG: metallophosphoesterase [Myxococcales bacterium]|nr:metallophosphoesterase [Myxococcales bacterium]MCB9732107.1 metallophosphoesterase [Deltaproteobacteria bacterium]
MSVLAALATGLVILAAPPPTAAAPAPVSQWDFDGDLASSNGAEAIEARSHYLGGKPDVRFDDDTIGGAPARVAYVTKGSALGVRHGLGGNAGGVFLNAYTLVIDLKLDARAPRQWAAILQTHAQNVNDAEWAVDRELGLGGRERYGGRVEYGRWYRLALVVDPASGLVSSYIDGVLAVAAKRAVLDGRYSLEPIALLFADDDHQTTGVWVNSLQIRAEALSAAAIAALGGPTADGVPRPEAPTLAVTAPKAGARVAPGSTLTIAWTADNPQGRVEIDLLDNDKRVAELTRAPAHLGRFTWRVPLGLGASDAYQVRVYWRGARGETRALSPRFGIAASASAAGSFGENLVVNGAFDKGLNGWKIVRGAARLGPGDSGQGVAGVDRDYDVQQTIDLGARGFSDATLDAGVVMDASARLKAHEEAGKFDDHGYLRVSFRDAGGRELGSARTMPGADDHWRDRAVRTLVPPGTRALRVELIGLARRGNGNDTAADNVVVKLLASWPQAEARVTKEPLLFGPGIESAVVLWETNGAEVEHRVRWRKVGAKRWRPSLPVEATAVDATHLVLKARLAPLERDAHYEYVVESGGASTPVHTFKSAAKVAADYRVTWVADNQNGYETFRRIIGRLDDAKPDLAIFPGDIVQHGMILREWQEQWFGPLSERSFGAETPIVFARGNHDGEHVFSYAFSALPGNGSWFAFTYGRVRYIVLDTEAAPAAAPRQHRWLQRELASPASKRATFRVVVLHKPPYSNLWDRPVYDGQSWVRQQWVPLFEQKGVDLVVAGHAHGYQRFENDGVTYLVVGGGGGTLDTVKSGNWAMAKFAGVHHYAIMDVVGDELRWDVRNEDGSPLDSFVVRPRAARAVTSAAP